MYYFNYITDDSYKVKIIRAKKEEFLIVILHQPLLNKYNVASFVKFLYSLVYSYACLVI